MGQRITGRRYRSTVRRQRRQTCSLDTRTGLGGSLGVKLERGAMVVVELDPTVGHEQRGIRPCVIVSDPDVIGNQSFPPVCMVPVTGTSGQELSSPALPRAVACPVLEKRADRWQANRRKLFEGLATLPTEFLLKILLLPFYCLEELASLDIDNYAQSRFFAELIEKHEADLSRPRIR